MTNKDKLLKENVDPSDLIEAFIKYYHKHKEEEGDVGGAFVKYMNEETQPTLTEDERVILKNIKGQPRYISRQKGHGLMAYDSTKRVGKTGWSYDNGRAMYSFSHLFQFIKERRRIFN